MVLAAHQRPGVAILWFVLVVWLALMFIGQQTGRLSRTGFGLMGLCLVVLALFIRRWRLRSIELTVPPPGVKLREVMPTAREYAYREGKNARDNVFRPDLTVPPDELLEWVCANCRQANPASFDVCWKCNHGRPRDG
jgi:hypothetical protein